MSTQEDGRAWGRRRVLLLVVAGVVWMGAVVGAVYLFTADDPDPTVAHDALAEVESPGTGWAENRLLEDVSSARARYQVGWAVRVDPGEEGGRCAEAAAWLVAAGALMPGEPVFDTEPPPTESDVGDDCVRAIESFQGAGSDVFAGWPNTKEAGYQFGPYLMFQTDGGPGGSLMATVEARQE
ncbi:MAG: hypothetical protein ABWZ91_00015 [Nocardioides sp.]